MSSVISATRSAPRDGRSDSADGPAALSLTVAISAQLLSRWDVFFLTAGAEQRAQEDLSRNGRLIKARSIRKLCDAIERDLRDSTRSDSPLSAEDAGDRLGGLSIAEVLNE